MRFIVEGTRQDNGEKARIVVSARSPTAAERHAEQLGLSSTVVRRHSPFHTLARSRLAKPFAAIACVLAVSSTIYWYWHERPAAKADRMLAKIADGFDQAAREMEKAEQRRPVISEMVNLTMPIELLVYQRSLLRQEYEYRFEVKAHNQSQHVITVLVGELELLDLNNMVCARERASFDVSNDRPMNPKYEARAEVRFRDVPDQWNKPFTGTPPIHLFKNGEYLIRSDRPPIECGQSTFQWRWIYMQLADGTVYGNLAGSLGLHTPPIDESEPFTTEDIQRQNNAILEGLESISGGNR